MKESEGERNSETPVVLEASDSLDLHGFLPHDIPSVVDEFLVLCSSRGVKVTRLIHGKGKGVQREIVRKLLAAHPLVFRFAPASALYGGEGATIVWLVESSSSNLDLR